jgi:hypothetical protein
VYHSTLGSRVIKKKKKAFEPRGPVRWIRLIVVGVKVWGLCFRLKGLAVAIEGTCIAGVLG